MLQKTILAAVNLGLLSWILLDIINMIDHKQDTRGKLTYLESVNSDQKLREFYKTYEDYYYKSRPSIQLNYEKFLNLDFEKINFLEDLEWSSYIDEYDYELFRQEILSIPELNEDLVDERLGVIRNKIKYSLLLNYGANIIGSAGQTVCYGSYTILKDISNNLTLAYSCSSYNYKTSINGYIVDLYERNKIKIPLADSLAIVTQAYTTSHRLSNRDRDSILSKTIIDVRNFLP